MTFAVFTFSFAHDHEEIVDRRRYRVIYIYIRRVINFLSVIRV